MMSENQPCFSLVFSFCVVFLSLMIALASGGTLLGSDASLVCLLPACFSFSFRTLLHTLVDVAWAFVVVFFSGWWSGDFIFHMGCETKIPFLFPLFSLLVAAWVISAVTI